MGDSENSRTLPPVTRTSLQSTSVAWLTAQIADASPAASAGSNDRVLSLWLQWMAAHRTAERLCRRQQRLERRLVTAIGFPRVEILAADMERPVTTFAASDVDSLPGRGAGTADAPTPAKPTRRARKQVWVVMDKPRRFIADIVAKPDAAFFTDASGQHRTNDRKLAMALASRS
ncbi:hypothetical protein [Phyllobacterium brassicacearum]|uniref:hypothetical protein n=1 Tax=Phyllobacterium brassicacearum TaxID=314235 RepID=UPI00105CBAD6|nr:hypothetical protein [Phyllobacterium brassicacearum]TDQ14873.1 hypothetical protein DEV91_13635 [Phyllobacterium brassicacearum]